MSRPWLHIAIDELVANVAEFPDPGENPRIALYLATVGMPGDDEISWCAGFVNYCLIESGVTDTPRRPNARSFLPWGASSPFQPGAIAVLWRESKTSWKGHVGFALGSGASHVYILGGNQRNRVCIEAYPLARVLDFRMPIAT